jgi:hypothetical protein
MKRNLFFTIIALAGFMFGFSNCLGDTNSSSVSSYTSPAVVGFDPYGTSASGLYFSTYVGDIVPDAASQSILSDYQSGDCAVTAFTIDSRDQIGGDYFVASSMNVTKLEQTAARNLTSPEDTTGYAIPISAVEFFDASCHANYKGKFFVYTSIKKSKTQAVDYLLAGDFNNKNEKGAYDLYLKAKLIGVEGTAETTREVWAFDLQNMMYSSGRDTTIYYESVAIPLRYLKINLKYYAGVEDDEVVYENAYSSPIDIYIYRN